jgi:predicted lipid-binding transport protein (Tim44 family)
VHLTPLDIFLFGLVVFAAWRLYNSRKRDRRPPDQGDQTDQSRRIPGPGPSQDSTSDSTHPEDDEEARRQQATEAYRRAQAAWDHLRSDSRPTSGPAPTPNQDAAAEPGQPVPAHEDDAAFLAGAKAMYARVRESWGDRDLDDLAQFLTKRCLAEFTARAEQEKPAGRTDVMLVEAQLLSMTPDKATVRYTALIREANVGDAPHQAREDWTFLRPADQPDAMWKLDAAAEPAD